MHGMSSLEPEAVWAMCCREEFLLTPILGLFYSDFNWACFHLVLIKSYLSLFDVICYIWLSCFGLAVV